WKTWLRSVGGMTRRKRSVAAYISSIKARIEQIHLRWNHESRRPAREVSSGNSRQPLAERSSSDSHEYY
ncbi:hypothetical protein, partial [Pseudomonas aeruginosa]|uniref:hypothetical protein n=1 Tax=Pseudomonas aeruginosa TaxID=287 RepID=UPI001968EF5E